MGAKWEWACPKCGAGANEHGKGKCLDPHGCCEGFLCQCYDAFDEWELDRADDPDHGEHTGNPCRNAVCYHCGWEGEFPPPPFDVKRLKGWAKKAWDAGWKPPEGWRPEEKKRS